MDVSICDTRTFGVSLLLWHYYCCVCNVCIYTISHQIIYNICIVPPSSLCNNVLHDKHFVGKPAIMWMPQYVIASGCLRGCGIVTVVICNSCIYNICLFMCVSIARHIYYLQHLYSRIVPPSFLCSKALHDKHFVEKPAIIL